MELLKEEIDSGETHIVVNALHQLPTIATVMGPQKVKSELIPYLSSNFHLGLFTEQDEVLFALSQELGNLEQHSPGCAKDILPLLEHLAGVDETVVREQAVNSIISVSKALSESEVENLLAPSLLKLASAENFSSRVSACSLVPCVFSRSASERHKLWAKFLELSREETPMVRRAAVKQMGNLAKVMEKTALVSELLPDLRQLAQDEQDQVRIICIETLVQIAKIMTKEENKLHTLPIIIVIGGDKSWRVRYHFAEMFPEIIEAFGMEITESSLIQTFSSLLKDVEADVKSAALISLKQIVSCFSPDKITNLIFPSVESILSDTSLTVKTRKNAAGILGPLAKILGEGFTASKIQPIFISILQQEPNSEIKMNVLENLTSLAGVLGEGLVSEDLVESLFKLVEECPQWRVREAITKVCGVICKNFGGEVFSRLEKVLLHFLSDSVAQVRDSGVQTIASLSQMFSSDWVNNELLPKMQEMYSKDLSYLYRITLIQSLGKLPVEPDQLVTVFSSAAKDSVPNVRLALCKVIKERNQNSFDS